MAPDHGIGDVSDPATLATRSLADQADVAPTLLDRLERVLARIDALRDRPALALALAAASVAVVGSLWWLGRPGSVAPVEAGIPMASSDANAGSPAAPLAAPTPTGDRVGPAADSTEAEPFVVHVAGAVANPGLVTLDPGSRIGDAVEAAGGATADADLHQLNLAALVVDGLQVRVPLEGELVPPTGMGPTQGDDAPIPVNTATEAELQELPGIGPSLAAAIVEWRSSNGPFATIDDLLAVPGIGPAKLEGLVDHVAL